jgi:predicted hotdog family 3-hydroxylacyl-ACP dehydratase
LAEGVQLPLAVRCAQLSWINLHALLGVHVQVVKAYQYTSLTSVTLLVRDNENVGNFAASIRTDRSQSDAIAPVHQL